ncbi:MAG: ferritin family protein [Deltaproteobacteria bacterium]|jgi:rubrerythrin|nr:ferritin family protein [Deltaproteobacteria bacterium]
MNKSFADQLISKAMQREEDAYKLYSDAATMVNRSEVKKLFEDLAKQELGHKETLSKINLDDFENASQEKLSDPNLSQLVEAHSLNEGFTLQDALLFAIKREDESYRFYKEFSLLAEQDALKNIFKNLAKMEMQHKMNLEEIYEDKIYQEN